MRKYLIGFLFFTSLVTCTKEYATTRPYPRLQTLPVTDVTSSGATFQSAITYSPSPIIDHGFLWTPLSDSPTISNSDTVSLGAFSSPGDFSAPINRSLLAGTKYFVRAYARTSDYFVYGNSVSFDSRGSESPYSIISVDPTQHLMPKTQITIAGNFGSSYQVKLSGNVLDSKSITLSNPNWIKFVLPNTTKNLSAISVVVDGTELVAKNALSMILSYKNEGPSFGGTLNYSANCFATGKDYFGFGIVKDASTGSSHESNLLFSYDLASDQIVSIPQSVISPRFGPGSFSLNNICYFVGGQTLKNGGLNDFYSLDPVTNSITRLMDAPFPISTNNYGYNSNHVVATLTTSSKAYCLVYVDSAKSQLYEFDPSTLAWKRKPDFPGTPRQLTSSYRPFAFVLNDICYVGGTILDSSGNLVADFWTYDPTGGFWLPLSFDVPLVAGNYSAVTANGKVFLVDYEPVDNVSLATRFYEFSPVSKSFTLTSYTTPLKFSFNGSFGGATTGYFYSGWALWEFDPTR